MKIDTVFHILCFCLQSFRIHTLSYKHFSPKIDLCYKRVQKDFKVDKEYWMVIFSTSIFFSMLNGFYNITYISYNHLFGIYLTNFVKKDHFF